MLKITFLDENHLYRFRNEYFLPEKERKGEKGNDEDISDSMEKNPRCNDRKDILRDSRRDFFFPFFFLRNEVLEEYKVGYVPRA